MESLTERSKPQSNFKSPRALHEFNIAEPDQAFPPNLPLFSRISPVVEEMMVNIDFNGAGLRTSATER